MSETAEPLPSALPGAPIVAGRVTLRTMRDADIAGVVGYRLRPAVHAYLSHGDAGQARLEAKFRQRIQSMGAPNAQRSEVQFVVEREGRVIGDCGFTLTPAWTKDEAPTCHLDARIHYALDDAEAGRGHGTEVAGALVTHVLSEPRVHRVQADVFAPNLASRRVLEKLGFRREGYFREDAVIDGEFVDACVYSLLRQEWQDVATA